MNEQQKILDLIPESLHEQLKQEILDQIEAEKKKPPTQKTISPDVKKFVEAEAAKQKKKS